MNSAFKFVQNKRGAYAEHECVHRVGCVKEHRQKSRGKSHKCADYPIRDALVDIRKASAALGAPPKSGSKLHAYATDHANPIWRHFANKRKNCRHPGSRASMIVHVDFPAQAEICGNRGHPKDYATRVSFSSIESKDNNEDVERGQKCPGCHECPKNEIHCQRFHCRLPVKCHRVTLGRLTFCDTELFDQVGVMYRKFNKPRDHCRTLGHMTAIAFRLKNASVMPSKMLRFSLDE